MELSEIKKLAEQIGKAASAANIAELAKSLAKLKKLSQEADFWQDNVAASKTMQKISDYETEISSWRKLEKDTAELLELAKLNDAELEEDLRKHFDGVERAFQAKKSENAFSGPFDKHGAIINIFAGAGGTDAQDWAQMLVRMYVRWAEAKKFKVKMLEESPGDEAGLKSAVLEIAGSKIYGQLKGEHGVHRLVRLSPFNSGNLRQTSFARVEVLPEIDEPRDVPIEENDLRIDVFRASGHGGQSVNTTDSAVRVTHLPTGIVVSIQNERSQLQNKETAMTILRSKLARLQLEQHKKTIKDLKGPSTSAEWGSQIRNYVLHPYKQVKDLRTNQESKQPEDVLDGNLDDFIAAWLTLGRLT